MASIFCTVQLDFFNSIYFHHRPAGRQRLREGLRPNAKRTVRFYKDGYTDLCGRFDYSSLNTNELDVAQKFSLLILTEENGAVVREANPPKRLIFYCSDLPWSRGWQTMVPPADAVLRLFPPFNSLQEFVR